MATHSIIISGAVPSPATLHQFRSLHFPISISLPSNLRTAKLSLRQNPNSNSPPSMSASDVRSSSSAATGEVSGEVGTASSGLVGQNDLLIVGPGVLGRLVAQKWREEHPGCQVYGQTATMDHHDELIQMGINPTVKGTKLPNQFPYVIFCAPPSGNPDYAGDVREAASSWSGEGCFAFTSTTALVDCDEGYCDEDTPVVPVGRSPRTDVFLKAEKVVLDYGGCVLRLAGLYKADRGAHTYWLRQMKSELGPDQFINQIHYEDATSLAVAILRKNLRGRVFLGCDNQPLSRHEIMDLVNKSGKFDGRFEGFTGTSGGPLGKKLNNSKTREEIGWKPKYPSFAQFLEEL